VASLQSLAAVPVPRIAAVKTAELELRPSRVPNLELERRVLGELTQALAVAPRLIWQELADAALRLCKADSVVVSVLDDERGAPVFRWYAHAGALAPPPGPALPRASSPCRTVTASLPPTTWPIQHFIQIAAHGSGIEEGLVVSFRSNDKPLGTICVVSHDETRPFDTEDARVITSLGQFASAACEVIASMERLESDLACARQANAQLAVADRNRDRFMAILAHELRSQLAPAQNVAELLKSETLTLATRRRLSGIIDRHVGGMSRLVDDLLGIARLRAGTLQLQRTAVSLAEVIDRTLELVQPAITARNHSVVLDVSAEIFLDADIVWLSQALQNLFGNAVKYTEPGGRIVVTSRRDGNNAVITVKDNGAGIATADLEAIFDLYVQLSDGRARGAADGLGVGLYLVRLLVDAQGGSIEAQSAGLGRGSEFTVRLPCHGHAALPGRISKGT
jgi:signal transduction histidine kinase